MRAIKNKPGYALLLFTCLTACLLLLAALFAKIVYNGLSGAEANRTRAQAFYLAEAGIEKAKTEIAANPAWYTDLPYYLEDNADWLVNHAVGHEENLGDGNFKIIREQGKNRLYSVGEIGQGVVILKLRFSAPPLTVATWEEI